MPKISEPPRGDQEGTSADKRVLKAKEEASNDGTTLLIIRKRKATTLVQIPKVKNNDCSNNGQDGSADSDASGGSGSDTIKKRKRG